MSEKELSNIDVALFALYRLGGAQRPVDTEDVAIECWTLAPKILPIAHEMQLPLAELRKIQ